MQQCWNADISKRPNAQQLMNYFADECKKTAQSSKYGRDLVKQNNASTIHEGDDIKQSSIYEFDNLPTPRNATLGKFYFYNIFDF